MIEASRETQSAVDSCIVFCRHVRNSARFHKGDKLFAPGIEKHVPYSPNFFDLYCVRDHRCESQNALVKLTGLVEVKCGKTDMRKSFMTHNHSPLRAISNDPHGISNSYSLRCALRVPQLLPYRFHCFLSPHYGDDRPPRVCAPVIQCLSDLTAATNEIVKTETISRPWRDESAHLGVCADRAPIARHPLLRPADLVTAGAQAAQ